jgi:hypothetical protein
MPFCAATRTRADDVTKVQLANAEATVRSDFSKGHYCPASQISASWFVPASPPPPDIASDPQRVVLWRSAELERAKVSNRRFIMAEGCGQRAVYACWAVGGPRASFWERGPGYRLVGSACLEQAEVRATP